MTALTDFLDANIDTLAQRDAFIKVHQDIVTEAGGWFPIPDFTGRYAEDDANALWVSGNLIKKGGTRGVGGTTIRLKGAGLANLLWEDAPALVTQILADTAGYPTLNLIRLPVYADDWDGKTADQKTTHFNTVIKPCVDLITAAGKYAIIDYHSVADWNGSSRFESTKNFALYFAEKFKGNPNVIFEMFNEPVAPVIYPWAINDANRDNWLAWRAQYQAVVNLWRYLCHNILIVGSPRYSTACIWADTYPFVGENLAYTYHAYPNWTGGLRDYLGMPVTAASSQTILTNAIPKNSPVFMSELGFANPDFAPGNETNLSNDVNYPVGCADFLAANKNVHPTIWAHSIFGLGTLNAYGQDMKAWWTTTLPTLTT